MSALAVGQRIDHLSQSGQTGIDLLSLVQSFTLCASLCDLFTACQINQIQLSRLCSEINSVVLADGENEDHMRPRGTFIHVGGSNRPTIPCNFYQFVNLLHRRNVVFGQILNKDAPLLIRPNLKIALISVQQVLQLLHIELHQRHLDPKLHVLIKACYRVKHMLHHPRNYTRVLSYRLAYRALHRVRLARGRLPIGKDGAVEAFNH